METVVEASTTHGIVYVVMALMGYAIFLAFLFIAMAKKEIRHLRKDYERDLKFFKESVRSDFEWIKEDNRELKRQVRSLENKGQ